MSGIQQPSTLRAIAKIGKKFKKDKGVKYNKKAIQRLASHAIYQYIKTFDQGGTQGGIFVQR